VAQHDPESSPSDTTASLGDAALADHVDPVADAPLDAGERMIVITRGPGAGSSFALVDGDIRIGRHAEAHILLDDVTVSRRHALITMVDGRAVLTDQASLNGTYVAGERVDSHVLSDGDEVQIGRFHLAYREGIPSGRDSSHDA
jgi:pSer/pThr/pTyr-binding forkhead associated (FHA) protein